MKGVGFGVAIGDAIRIDFGYKLDAIPRAPQVVVRQFDRRTRRREFPKTRIHAEQLRHIHARPAIRPRDCRPQHQHRRGFRARRIRERRAAKSVAARHRHIRFAHAQLCLPAQRRLHRSPDEQRPREHQRPERRPEDHAEMRAPVVLHGTQDDGARGHGKRRGAELRVARSSRALVMASRHDELWKTSLLD